jgi:diguanylate cyclase (GGDEF)-like protein
MVDDDADAPARALDAGEEAAARDVLNSLVSTCGLGWAGVYLPVERGWELLTAAGDHGLPQQLLDLAQLPEVPRGNRRALSDGDSPLGVLVLDEGPLAGTVAAQDLLEAVTNHLTNVLRSSRLLREAIERAVRDELTGLYSRRFFDESLERAIADRARRNESLAVLYADVDGFKRINDEHGHAAGDDALRAVGRALQSSVRASDLAARIGGDEFAAIMPRCDRQGAWIVAERIRTAIVGKVHIGGEPISMSIGIAVSPSDADDPQMLCRRADDAVYWAKRSGKNLVVLAGDVGAADAGERERVVGELIGRLVRGKLAAGSAISEQELASELVTPRGSLREALLRLQAEGLLASGRSGGFVVAPLTAVEMRGLYPILGALEILALRTTCHSSDELDELARINSEFAAANGQSPRRIELDQHFHAGLVRSCSNAPLLELIESLKHRIRRYQYSFMCNMPTMRTSVEQHAAIVTALRRGDVEEAVRNLELNWSVGIRPLLALLEPEGQAASG